MAETFTADDFTETKSEPLKFSASDFEPQKFSASDFEDSSKPNPITEHLNARALADVQSREFTANDTGLAEALGLGYKKLEQGATDLTRAAVTDLANQAVESFTGRKPETDLNILSFIKGETLPADEQLKALSQEYPNLSAVGKTAQGVAGSIPMLVGLSKMGALPKIIQRAATLGFSADMLSSFKDSTEQLVSETEKPESEQDQNKIADLKASLVQSGVFGAFALAHGSIGKMEVKTNPSEPNPAVETLAKNDAPQTAAVIAEITTPKAEIAPVFEKPAEEIKPEVSLEDLKALKAAVENKVVADTAPKPEADTITEATPKLDESKPVEEPAKETSGVSSEVPQTREHDATSLKNATAEMERAGLGLPEAESPAGRKMAERWIESGETLSKDPTAGQRLADEVIADPERGMSDDESALLLRHKATLFNALNDAAENVIDGGQEARNRYAALKDQFETLLDAIKKRGTSWGREGRWRQAMAYEDFSFATQERLLRAAKGGEALTDAEHAKLLSDIAEHKEKSAALEKHLAERDARIAELESKQAADELIRSTTALPTIEPHVKLLADRVKGYFDNRANEALKRIKKRRSEGVLFSGIDPTPLADYADYGAAKILKMGIESVEMAAEWAKEMKDEIGDFIVPHLNQIWEASKNKWKEKADEVSGVNAPKVKRVLSNADATEKKAAITEQIKTKIGAGNKNDIMPQVQNLARHFVEQGVKNRDELVDAVHGVLQSIDPTITRSETGRAIAGYGDFRQLSKDEISVQLRDYKGQLQQVYKLEDMQAGKAPEKTGVERRAPSDEERKLIKQVNEAKKKGGFAVTNPETQLKSALQSRKTYYTNRLADLRSEIASKERDVKTKTPSPTDAELESLKSEYEKVKQEHDSIFGDRTLTDEQRLKMAMDGVERDISNLERKIKEKDFSENKKSKVAETPELKAAKSKRDALREEFNELRDLDEHFQNEQHRKSLEREKKSLEESIAEKQNKLASGDVATNPRAVDRPDSNPEIESLKQQRDALNKQISEARKKPDAQKDADAIERKIKDLNKRIEKAEEKLASGDVSTTKSKVNRPLANPELEMAKQRLELLNKQIEELRNPPKTPEQRALQSFKTRTAKRIAELESKTASGDFSSRPKRPGPVLDEEAARLKADKIRVEERFADARRSAELRNRSMPRKIYDFFTKWLRREAVLSSPVSLVKLATAAFQGLTLEPIKEYIGAKTAEAFPEFGKRTEAESPSSLKIEANALTQAFMKALGDADQTLKTGKSDLEVAFGGKRAVPEEMVSYFGRLHGAIKTPLKRAAFERVFAKLARDYTAKGLDVTDPLVQMRMGNIAMREANRMLFLEDNAVVDAYQRLLSRFDQKQPNTGKPTVRDTAVAGAMRLALPIVRIPTNLISRTLQAAFGAPIGGAKLAMAYGAEYLPERYRNLISDNLANGIKNLPPEEADLIMRQIKQGSVGAALMLYGFLNAEQFGGYYQPGEKRDEKDVKAGAMRIAGVEVPSYVLHHPLLQVMQFGATVRRVADSKLHRKDLEEQGVSAGGAAAMLGLISEQAFVKEMIELNKIIDPKQREKALGAFGAGLVEPQLLMWLAKQTDKTNSFSPFEDAAKRNPVTFSDHLKMGIPGLRETVPVKKK